MTARVEVRGENSFDLIRLLAALCVFFGHQAGMLGLPAPVTRVGDLHLAALGLYVFFALSGYLVYKSLERDGRPSRYFAARALRIYPGLMANIVVLTFVGAFLTTLSAADYFSAPGTYAFLRNVFAVVTPTEVGLPGVFTNSRWATVNGSIWTIKYEILCYGMLFALFWGLATVRLRGLLFVCILALFVAAHWYLLGAYKPGPEFFSGYNPLSFTGFTMTFLFGACYASREPMPERERVLFFLLPALAVVLSFNADVGKVAVVLVLAVSAIEIGRTRWLYSARYAKIGDLSYGLFLYAYPTQNLFVTYFYDGSNAVSVTALTLVVLFALAALSWHLVEKPMLALKPSPGAPHFFPRLRSSAAPQGADARVGA